MVYFHSGRVYRSDEAQDSTERGEIRKSNVEMWYQLLPLKTERPTSNFQRPRVANHVNFDVGRWMFDVGCSVSVSNVSMRPDSQAQLTPDTRNLHATP